MKSVQCDKDGELCAEERKKGVNLITVMTVTLSFPSVSYIRSGKYSDNFGGAKALTRVTVAYLFELKIAKMVRGLGCINFHRI